MYEDSYFTCRTVFRVFIQGGADKSLARPGRKQATATNLGIYSPYSPRSSIHFLARCSNFCKPLQKKIWRLSVQPGLHGSNELRVGRKMSTFQSFFQSRERVVVRRSQIREIGWVIKKLESQVDQFLLWARTLPCKNKTPLVTLPRHFSLKMSLSCINRDE